jgi:hypothetical protein
MTGSGALRRFLDGRRRTQGPFLLNQVLGCGASEDRFVHML